MVGLLYLGVAAASLLVLGPATGSTEAPLAELLAIGIGGEVRVLTAIVALLLTLGAMNAYFAGAAKLGAALGRDGALPAWFARGSSAGQVPRRSLAVASGLSVLALVAVAGAGPRLSVLLTTGSFVLVYVLGMAAAVRLLPRRSWSRRGAVVALASVTALLFMLGAYVLWTLAIAGVAAVYEGWRRRVARIAEQASDSASDPVGVVAQEERGPLLVGQHKALGDPREGLEVVLARGTGCEQQQHRCRLA